MMYHSDGSTASCSFCCCYCGCVYNGFILVLVAARARSLAAYQVEGSADNILSSPSRCKFELARDWLGCNIIVD